MIKSEPRTILNFLHTYFDILKELFQVQSREGIIHRNTLALICQKYQSEIQNKLVEHKILRVQGDDYQLRDVYYKLIEFILHEFRALLPEEIEKYGLSISILFKKIQEGEKGDRKILLDRIFALAAEIRELTEMIEKNTIRLLNETREIKANVQKIDYRVKVQRASHWIEYYINPLNTILDIHHPQSIANKLFEISLYANKKRLNYHDISIRSHYEQLYTQLVKTNDDLLRQSKILTNELLPLIERIRTESMILTGWLEFLKNPYRFDGGLLPNVFKAERDAPYSNKMYYNAKEYFEQFLQQEDSIIVDEAQPADRWIFNRAYYKEALKQQLPMDDFFSWCSHVLENEQKEITNEKICSMMSLLFEEGLEIDSNSEESTSIKTQNSIFRVPKLRLKDNGISKTA
jgi:hypothetical protein